MACPVRARLPCRAPACRPPCQRWASQPHVAMCSVSALHACMLQHAKTLHVVGPLPAICKLHVFSLNGGFHRVHRFLSAYLHAKLIQAGPNAANLFD